jgi:hypothetical protein
MGGSNIQQEQEPEAQEQELPQEQEEFPQPDMLMFGLSGLEVVGVVLWY